MMKPSSARYTQIGTTKRYAHLIDSVLRAQ